MGTNFAIKKKAMPSEQTVKPKVTLEMSTHNSCLTIYDNGLMSVGGFGKIPQMTVWEDRDKNGKYEQKTEILFGSKNPNQKIVKLNENQNNVKEVQQRLIAQLKQEEDKYQKSLRTPFKINGRIDEKVSQSRRVGDCWLIAGIISLAHTKQGAKDIKNLISQDKKNGNVTVKLAGLNKTCTFTPKEIIDAEGRLSKGDDDARVIEMAMEKYRPTSNETNVSGNAKQSSSLKKKNPLSGGLGDEALFTLTGKRSNTTWNNKVISKEKIPYLPNRGMFTDNNKLNKILDIKQKYPDRLAMTTGFLEGKGVMLAGHEYSIEAVTKDYVIVINPWDTSTRIKIKRPDFVANCESISGIDVG